MEDWLIFAMVMAIGQLTPGPDMLLILKNTLNHGLRLGLITISGICTGLCVHTVAAFSGVGLLLNRSPKAFRALEILGGAYLLWIAWKIVKAIVNERRRGISVIDKEVIPITGGEAYREGLFTNLLNVKVVIFFSSLFVSFAGRESWSAPVYAAIILIEAMTIWPLFAWMMQKRAVQRVFFRYQNLFNGIFAAMLFGLAVHLWWL